MSVFVDTGVFYAHHGADADRHEATLAAMDGILDGTYGQPYTSDYVFDETVTLTRVRTGSFDAADTVARRILGEGSYPEVFEMLQTGSDDFRDALETFRRYNDHQLSFTDAMTVSLCKKRGIDAVLSFDSGFDGIYDRVDPSTE
jgi:predicted nucleic acid-binding protein